MPETVSADVGESKFLSINGLYKSLSLFHAARRSVPILPTRLQMSFEMEDIEGLARSWGFPIVVRLDYKSLPESKPRGGVHCSDLQSLARTCKSLLESGLYPLLHPYVDRFRNQYSVGVVMDARNEDIIIEGVGKGFDAGDLRLGAVVPHETIACSIWSDDIENRRVIGQELYSKERLLRLGRIASLKRYQNEVEHTSNLGIVGTGETKKWDDIANGVELVPEFFSPMSRGRFRDLMNALSTVWAEVLPELPTSEKYVASFSFLPRRGWILWDIYGKWYLR